MELLSGIRVVSLGGGIACGYASKLFADAGADVITIEAPDGEALRRWSSTGADLGGRDGAFFRYLHAGQRSVAGSVTSAPVRALIGSAEIVIDTILPSDPIDALPELDRPELVRLSITPYGRTGPYADRPATEFVVQAESGSGARRGLLDRPPYQAGGRITEYVAAAYGATAALAALRAVGKGGPGEHVDVSWLECITLAANIFADLGHRLAGRPPLESPPRWVELPSIEPTADGWVGFNTNSRQQYDDFLVLIGQTDMDGAEELADWRKRQRASDRWNAAVRSYTTRHTTAEIVELAQALRIPVAPVNSGRSVLSDPHLRFRGAFVLNPDGDFEQPRAPYLFDGEALVPGSAAPRLGEHNGHVESRSPRGQIGGAPSPALPLEGIRIIDCTAWWAGPSSTVTLAALGADVIHVESVNRPDAARMSGSMWARRDSPWWECSSMFLSSNTNKRGITLDLRRSAGIEAMTRLIRTSDALVENYSPRVIEQFGLDWEAFGRINPRAVLVRMPAFGLTGPWREAVGFAQTMEQMTGLAWITGFPDDQPRIPQGPCDPLAGTHAAFALVAALERRDRTGSGCLVEVPMVEAALNAASESIVEWSCYGNEMQREGNRSPYAAPQGLYECRGGERWLAISCETETHWKGLTAALGEPAWTKADRFGSLSRRRRHHDDLDSELQRWAAGQELDEAVERLIRHGVPAGAARDPRLISDHPQHVARRFHEELDHPVVGVQPVVRPPFLFHGQQRWLRHRAPLFGEHNHEVLSELGYGDEEIEALGRDGVIGDLPAGVDPPVATAPLIPASHAKQT
jgi:crotonobetainyl-CoA:carnitine CoA-transferase CaiB-like acyl-CoA transferase